MQRKHYVGIDIGTSSIKAVVIDDAGSEIAIGSRATPVVAPLPNYTEVDMEQVWLLTLESCREALVRSRVEREITAIAITGMGCGSWLVDKNGNAVRSATLWNDGRAAEQVGQWQREGRIGEIFRISGNAIMPGWTVPVLRWLKDHQPEALDRAAYSLPPKDWIRLRLTGDIATDWSDASYVPFDIAGRKWSQELMDLAGISDLTRLLPPIRSGLEFAGEVRETVRKELGLPKGCRVITGLVDIAASTHGAGAIAADQACTILGTTCVNSMLFSSPCMEPVGIGMMLATVNDLWVRSLVNTAGTQNIDWISRILYGRAGSASFAALEQDAAQAPSGSRGLIFHPYLSSAGINAPFFHPAARGNFFGLTAEHSRSEIARAIFEGVALAILDCYSSMASQPQEVILAGGGNRSRLWCQMIADALAVPVLVPEAQELGARGVAMLAAVAAGQFDGLAAAARSWVRIKNSYEPSHDGSSLARILPLYRQIARDLSPRWWDRQELVQGRQ